MNNTQRIYCEKIFDGQSFKEKQMLSIVDGKVSELSAAMSHGFNEPGVIVLPGIIAPGFIDLQVNGGGGILFNQSFDIDSLKTMIQAHRQYGTTAMLPTVITDHLDVMTNAAETVKTIRDDNNSSVLGIHFEGPGISEQKKGTHSQDRIRPLSDKELALFCRTDLGVVMVTLAAEVTPIEHIQQLAESGVIVCIGHSNANYETALKAIAAGVRGFTHLYNAMSPLQSREPGVVGAALNSSDTWCGLIVDGHHVHPAAIEIALKAKTKDKLVLVTDAMAPVGTSIQRMPFFDREIICDGDKLTSTTGELAGSVLDMNRALKNMIDELSLNLSDALLMTSKNPADWVKVSNQYGKLVKGFRADFVQLDASLSVVSTWVGGQKVY